MIDGFATALGIVAQVASTTQTSLDIDIPGQVQDALTSILRRSVLVPKLVYATIDVTAIDGTPDLDVKFFIVDRASGKEDEIGEAAAIATVSKKVILIGDTGITAAGAIDQVLVFPLTSTLRVKGVTQVGADTPTITYTVGLEIAF